MNESSQVIKNKTNLNVLVTGATGFTGSALTKRLVDNGYCVRIIARNAGKIDSSYLNKIEVVKGSITDQAVVEEALKNIDLVFHIAAVYREAGISDQVYWDVHVKATEYLLEAALKNGVKRFIHCSTVGVHGHIAHPPANETYNFSPGDIYQLTKLEGEKKVFEFHKRTGLPVSVIRPGPIYGPGDLRLLKLFKMARQKYTLLLGDGEIFYQMVYIDDLVDAFLLASMNEKAIGEAFLIAGNETVTLNSLLDLISDILHYSKKKIYLPAKPFQIAGTICERICVPLGITPPIYRRRVDFFTKSRSFDISKAKKVLGFEPKVCFTKGIKITAEWYKTHNLL